MKNRLEIKRVKRAPSPTLPNDWDLGMVQWIEENSAPGHTPADDHSPKEARVDDDLLDGFGGTLDQYLRDLRSAPLLKREDEIRLACTIEDGQGRILGAALSSLLALRARLSLVRLSPHEK